MSWRTHARVGLAGALWACTACAAGSTPALDATPVVASRPATVPAPALGFVETPPTRPGASNEPAPAPAPARGDDEEDDEVAATDVEASGPARAASRRAAIAGATWTPPGATGRGGPTALPRPSSASSGARAAALLERAFASSRCGGGIPGGAPPSEERDPAFWRARPDESLEATRRGDIVLLYRTWRGSGVTAEHGVEITRYDARACTRQSISVEVGDGGLSARLFGDPGARVVQEAIGPRLDPDEPRHAYARLLATRGGVCEPDSGEDVLADEVPVSSVRFALQALPFTAQRWHRGRPRAQQRVWYPVDELDDQEGEAIAARVIAAPGAPRTLRRVGRHELFGAELHGRNGGFALGVFDRVGDRHRWVLVTRACLYGTTLRWLASGEGLVVGYAVSQHPIYAEDGRDGLFVVDLREGRAFRLLLEGSALVWEPCPGGAGTNAGADDDVEDGDEDGACDMSLRAAPTPALIGRFRHGAHALRTRSGARVTLEELRAALDQR